MSLEQIAVREVIEDYLDQGWQVGDPRAAQDVVGFLPDVVLRKGDRHLVIEVGQVGGLPRRSVSALRRAVEQHPDWRFEVKLVPSDAPAATDRVAVEEIRDRLDLADRLIADGHGDDALLLAWVAVEANLRRMLADDRDSAPGTLLRRAYDEDRISDRELRHLTDWRGLTNRIVHGFRTDTDAAKASALLGLARDLSDRAEPRAAWTVGPA
ncbi:MULTISPECIES: hypothetical protein [Methylobacterium]|uniref:REase AHJR-like domain-containing protein n=1 Tax=Methylobacterium isbiliense TaxID=315478 RepID=A0ABQ4S9X6_9HYPH|nr:MULTISPECIES: hypothetical protein [Methylobacterium]MBY0297025.1 hypothetical protein [Methylobacterium sp.]MDN3625525.1 hypothetical protein [Methylobacterium isbiliense]GJD98669.1 hypothetical protein GMJLKIPL_0580 [Methylobacterium isbiliense]